MKAAKPLAKYLVFALVLSLRASQNPAQQQTGSVDGQVTDSNTGEPVASATVHLVPLRYSRGGNSSQPEASSQSDGAFHFEAVSPGSYVLTAERAGFVLNKIDSKSPMITVAAGQVVTGVAVALTPQGTISGRIEEEDGTPLAGARVEALAPFVHLGQSSLKLYANTNADADGQFVLAKLPPNDYYLVAEPAASADKKPAREGDLVRTIYPRSLEIEGGSTIPLAAGQTVPDITIRVRRTTTFHVRGKIADAPTTGAGAKFAVAVSPRGSVDSISLTKKVTVTPEGTFDIGGLTPGAYTLRLTGPSGTGGRNHSLLTRQDVEIGGGNLEGIVLSIMPALTVTGQIRVDSTSNTSLPRVTLLARPLEDVSHSTQGFANVAGDGSFTLTNLDPGLYVFQARVGIAGWYVKSMTLNQQDILNRQVDLSEMSSARLEVSVSPGAGEVDVTVQSNAPATAAPDAGNTVILVPETVGPDGSGVLFGFARSNASYEFKNVAPGKYFGYAALRGDPNLWQNPEFLRAVASQGASLTVAEGSTQQIQLSLLPAELVEQAAGRVGLSR